MYFLWTSTVYYKLRYIVGFWLVEMAISTNQKPTIYRNLYENTGPVAYLLWVPCEVLVKAELFENQNYNIKVLIESQNWELCSFRTV